MGQTTDAILFYGFCWNDEGESIFGENEDGENKEWFEVVAKRRDISSPWTMYRSSGAEASRRVLSYKEQDAAYKVWKDQVGFDALLDTWREELDKIKAEYGNIEVGSHCSCDYPMPYVYIEASKLIAWRGGPVEVTTDHFDADRDRWDADLARFVEDLDIDVSDAQGPGWFLVSNWC